MISSRMLVVIDCVSDTHTYHKSIRFPPAPEGCVHVLVHAGDFTHRGSRAEIQAFANWFRQQPHKHKIVICGNHECNADAEWVPRRKEILRDRAVVYENKGFLFEADQTRRELKGIEYVDVASKFKNQLYLIDSGVEIAGLKFWGSPYSKEFHGWGFSVPVEDAAEKWAAIPDDVDVLVVHGPPKYHGDACPDDKDENITANVGCPELLARIRAVKPKVVITGHIHEAAGVYHMDTGTIVVNAAYVIHDRAFRGYKMRGVAHRVTIDTDTGSVSVTKVKVFKWSLSAMDLTLLDLQKLK